MSVRPNMGRFPVGSAPRLLIHKTQPDSFNLSIYYWSKPALLKPESDFQHDLRKQTQTDRNSPFCLSCFFTHQVSSVLKDVFLFFCCVKRQLLSPFSRQNMSFSAVYLRLCRLAGIPATWISSHIKSLWFTVCCFAVHYTVIASVFAAVVGIIIFTCVCWGESGG